MLNPGPRSSRRPHRDIWSRERLTHERAIAWGQSIAPGTHSAYGSALTSYLDFTRNHGFPTEPTPDTLSFYITYMSHYIKPDSVDSYVSGICHELEPYFPDVRLSRKSALVRRTMTGCKRIYGSPRKQRRNLTTHDLDSVLSHHQSNASHDDQLFCAMLLTGFFALMRLGELADPDTLNLRDPRKVIRRSSVEVTPKDYSFFLPGHKGDRFFSGNTIIIPKNSDNHDPYHYFVQYLSSRDQKFPLLSPLWLRDDGTTPTRSWFTRRLRRFFDSSVGGHSMRAGGATLLAELGTPPHLIQAIGRWKSDAFAAYIRTHPVLIQALLFSRRA
jgi:hypothetical protein